MNEPTVVDLRVEHGARFVGVAEPRLSWCTETATPDWWQAAYEVEVDGVPLGWVDDDDAVFRPWPASPLGSRDRRVVRVRVRGTDGVQSPWSAPLPVEAALLQREDWVASWISPVTLVDPDRSAPAVHLRRSFELTGGDGQVVAARLYVTSVGVHTVELNGGPVGDHVLAPGWSAYRHRLRYDTHDVTDLLVDGLNAIGIVVADGWWRGHLGFDGRRCIYGDRLGALAQLEVEWADGRRHVVVATDEGWRATTGPITGSDLYDGETHDARLDLGAWSTADHDDAGWEPVERFAPTVGRLCVPSSPPVRRIEELEVREVLTSPSGAVILDLGQNMVGRMRFTVEGPAGTEVTLRHAEVLEHGELATEPLRGAKATDRYLLRGGGPETWEPSFTFHGFRYVEVTGWPGELEPSAFRGIVLHSDMARSGHFSCSEPLLDRFHENVVWGMRGNFLDVPTDCPQRDERLGWTGDIQVFAPTASFLYDVDGFLSDWLEDLRADQAADGTVPSVVPDVPGLPLPPGAAAWGDAATVVPTELHRRYGDVGVLAAQLDSMRAWVDHVAERAGSRRIWDGDFQFGDWLDPTAPNDRPWQGRTDASIVATAYFARSADLVARAATVLGLPEVADRYERLAAEVRDAFRHEFVTPAGRIMSDSTTAYALALAFDLVEDPELRRRLARNLVRLSRESFFTITTGFVGTPLVLPTLTEVGYLRDAYALMLQTERPSWLYAVTMGATTVWERWDSLLPDGTVNGSGMTSFNHYAFGCAAQWLHETVAGIVPAAPGMRELTLAPRPGGGLTHAEATLRTPYGRVACRWRVEGTTVEMEVEVPANSRAEVRRPGLEDEPVAVGGGTHRWTYEVVEETADRWSAAPPGWSG